MTASISRQLTAPEFKADPYPLYARLRDEAPVCQIRLPDRTDAWMVSRYDDVKSLLCDERFVKDRANAAREGTSRAPWMPRFARPLLRNMLDVDPPDHTRLRALVMKAFVPSTIAALRPRIESVAAELLEKANRGGSIDLIRDFARPLPTIIITELLGIPGKDRERFHRWSGSMVSANASKMGMLRGLPGMIAFLRYIRRLIKSRRRSPGQDLIGALIEAEEGGDVLSEDELVAMVFLLLVAGYETTVNLIGNGCLTLLQHPPQLEHLRGHPEMIDVAVEELLRFQGPLQTATERYASQQASLGDVTIPRGALVFALLAAANRDPRQFEQPDSLQLDRSPNRHLAFGFGIHYCLGAPLARLEGQIAIAALLQHFSALQLAVPIEKLRWHRGLVIRGLQALPVAAT